MDPRAGRGAAAGPASYRRDDAGGAVPHALDELGPEPDAARDGYSVEDDTYIALYGVWQDAGEDEQNVRWATERMREMEALSSGIQLADENLGRRPARFASEQSMARLDEVRAAYDPDGLFHPWMGRLQ